MSDYINSDDTNIITKIYNMFFYLIENYGWYILLFLIIITVIYNKYLKIYVEKYKAYKFEKEYSAKYHKNPDIFARHITAQQNYVEKLQEKYMKDAEENLKKLEEKEEKKREEQLKKSEGVSFGHKLGNNDYNPLMGPGSSSNYRPKRKTACSGGGCGK